VSQPYYHALYRVAEVEHLPACAHYGLGVVSYSPLARGVLTGKYQPGAEAPKDTRAGRADKRMLQTEFRPETLAAAQKGEGLCGEAWRRAQPFRGRMGAE